MMTVVTIYRVITESGYTEFRDLEDAEEFAVLGEEIVEIEREIKID